MVRPNARSLAFNTVGAGIGDPALLGSVLDHEELPKPRAFWEVSVRDLFGVSFFVTFERPILSYISDLLQPRLGMNLVT